MKLRIYVFFCILEELCMLSKARTCIWSTNTVEKVKSCPVSISEWERRKYIKKCSLLAQKQNCTDVSNFEYHCVINEYENAFIEVCAPAYIINGYCAEYNELGARIQLHYGLRCEDVQPPCAKVYRSTEAYKYPGCYDIVERKLQRELNLSSIETTTIGTKFSSTTWNASVTETDENTTGSEEMIGIIMAVAILLIVIGILVLLFIFRKSKSRCACFSVCDRKTNDQDNDEMISLTTPNGQPQKPDHSSSLPMKGCEKCDFQYACAAGKLLLDMVRKNVTDTNMNARRQDNRDETNAFLEAYNKENESFVETNLTKKCKTQLEQTGLVVIIGKQGCGKTLTAVHIMKSRSYEGWVKRKFTSWEDLLAFNLNDKTLVYIDNIFDGYLYRHQLKKWWDTLCYFYFTFIKDNDSIRLIITAKDNAIKNACAHIKANFPVLKNHFFVEEESFPLSVNEMLSIVTMQVKLAEEIKNISRPIFTETLVTTIKPGDIGFPLRAHLYAFENRRNEKGAWIFDNPRAYVRNQIAYEITKDNTNGVKTLFLILLMYHSQPVSNHKMDFRYSEEWLGFLKEKCSESLINDMKPLKFENLNERAKELEGIILIKHFAIYEFQHQIYLEGLSDYFFRIHFEAAVQHFPLDILRTYEFHDISETRFNILAHRLIQELFKSALSEALICRLFERSECEERFCNELQKEGKLIELLYIPDKASPFSLPVIFWANKYGLKKLSKFLWHFVEKNTNKEDVHSQFYLARFGECCKNDENYITRTSMLLDVNDYRVLVCHYRFSGQRNILHLLISSDKSDYDAHRFMMKILTDSPDENVAVDLDLLTLALTNIAFKLGLSKEIVTSEHFFKKKKLHKLKWPK
uniref:Novel STAND NTPase 3 domain-containing protein n=1 Tax=Magallana gigas TaxID=29159 RepID=A0A8W8JBX9_MAGGI